jgi:hypothetical protein
MDSIRCRSFYINQIESGCTYRKSTSGRITYYNNHYLEWDSQDHWRIGIADAKSFYGLKKFDRPSR